MKDKRSQREFCSDLKRSAPEGSEEWAAFNNAESAYELAECLNNRGAKAHVARMRGSREYKRGWKLRDQRLNQSMSYVALGGAQ